MIPSSFYIFTFSFFILNGLPPPDPPRQGGSGRTEAGVPVPDIVGVGHGGGSGIPRRLNPQGRLNRLPSRGATLAREG